MIFTTQPILMIRGACIKVVEQADVLNHITDGWIVANIASSPEQLLKFLNEVARALHLEYDLEASK
jgi:hypothetical protein